MKRNSKETKCKRFDFENEIRSKQEVGQRFAYSGSLVRQGEVGNLDLIRVNSHAGKWVASWQSCKILAIQSIQQ